MDALHRLAADNTVSGEARTLAAEKAIKGYLAPEAHEQALDALDHEVAAQTGEFWKAARESIAQLRRAAELYDVRTSWRRRL